MTQIDLPDYTELNHVLKQATPKLHPSQVHGLICGLLCGSSLNIAMWKESVLGLEKVPKIDKELQALHAASLKQLKEFLFELKLLLPEDSATLPERAEALTLWSQGFLTGLKYVQIPIVERQPGEVTEAINDIIEIAKMNYEEVVASNEDEMAYVELVEYVRLAVILIYQALHADEASKQTTSPNKYFH
jgi:uncharacterized protein YgfB (UPF0149 family)